jgi:hypothetical protein
MGSTEPIVMWVKSEPFIKLSCDEGNYMFHQNKYGEMDQLVVLKPRRRCL